MGIQWIDQLLSCHVDEIDVQHKEFIRRVNEFAEAIAGGLVHETIAEILGFLRDYAAVHFACEEEHFVRRRCSPRACAANRVAHQQFLDELTAAKRDLEKGIATAALLRKLQSWLMNWLIHHIKTVDVRSLRAAVAAQSDGLSAG